MDAGDDSRPAGEEEEGEEEEEEKMGARREETNPRKHIGAYNIEAEELRVRGKKKKGERRGT